MIKFVQIAKLTSLIREKILAKFIANWKYLIDFLHEAGEKKNL